MYSKANERLDSQEKKPTNQETLPTSLYFETPTDNLEHGAPVYSEQSRSLAA